MTTRISETDTLYTIIDKMAAGNPGAMTVVSKMFTRNPAAILLLDQLEIYGTNIWQLYRNACKCSIKATIGALQAVHDGLIAPTTIREASRGYVEFTEQQLQQFSHLLDSLPPKEQ